MNKRHCGGARQVEHVADVQFVLVELAERRFRCQRRHGLGEQCAGFVVEVLAQLGDQGGRRRRHGALRLHDLFEAHAVAAERRARRRLHQVGKGLAYVGEQFVERQAVLAQALFDVRSHIVRQLVD